MPDTIVILHVGRVNIKITISDNDYVQELITAYNNVMARTELVNILKQQFIEAGEWSDEYTVDTNAAIDDNEYWIEITNNFDHPLISDPDLSPHQRYLNVKDRLDEFHCMRIDQN